MLNTSESKPVPALPRTARVKLEVHLSSQVDDTPAGNLAEWSGKRGSRGVPREAAGCPRCHHPDDLARGSRESQGRSGGFGDVLGVITSAGNLR